jgi:hypothetical protein
MFVENIFTKKVQLNNFLQSKFEQFRTSNVSADEKMLAVEPQRTR